jgi:hypothetical protein
MTKMTSPLTNARLGVRWLLAAIGLALGLGACVSEVIGWKVDLEPESPESMWKQVGKEAKEFKWESATVVLCFKTYWADGSHWVGFLDVTNKLTKDCLVQANPQLGGTRGVRILGSDSLERLIEPSDAITLKRGTMATFYFDAKGLGLSHPPRHGETATLDVMIDGSAIRSRFKVRLVRARHEVKPVFLHK